MLTGRGEGGIAPDELERFAELLFRRLDVPEETAGQVASSLVAADLCGHNSHGVRRILPYERLLRGERDDKYRIDATARPSIEADGPTHARIDGRNAFGQVVGREAVDVAVEKATDAGLGVVGVRDATHLGRIGEWSERATEAGFVFLAFVANQGGSTTAPPGSAERRFGTNPLSFGVPTFDALPFPVVLDMATTQVAAGKVKESVGRGASVPEAWTVDGSGESVTDPEAFMDGEGALLPLGGRTAGYKGFGLSMLTELLGAIAGDGLVTPQTDYQRGNAAMFIAVDPTLLTSRSAVEDRVAALAAYVRETDFSPDVSAGLAAYGDEAYLPGEPEHLVAADRREHGIPLPAGDVLALCELAIELGVEDRIPAEFREVVSTRG